LNDLEVLSVVDIREVDSRCEEEWVTRSASMVGSRPGNAMALAPRPELSAGHLQSSETFRYLLSEILARKSAVKNKHATRRRKDDNRKEVKNAVDDAEISKVQTLSHSSLDVWIVELPDHYGKTYLDI
jgi:hypothetical protein